MNKSILVIFIAGIMLLSIAAVSAQAEDSNLSENGIGTALSSEIHARQELFKNGDYNLSLGRFLNVKVLSENLRELRIGNATVETDMNLSIGNDNENNTHMNAHLKNGSDVEVKVMPDTASQVALARLKLKVCSVDNNCAITLKEVGQGNETAVDYEIKADQKVKVFGLFNAKMHVEAQINASTGEIIQSKVPWWSAISTKQ